MPRGRVRGRDRSATLFVHRQQAASEFHLRVLWPMLADARRTVIISATVCTQFQTIAPETGKEVIMSRLRNLPFVVTLLALAIGGASTAVPAQQKTAST